MLRLRSLSSQLQQPQLAKGRSDVRALFFIKHLQLKSLLKQVEAGELEIIGINWRSENRVEHRFIMASSSLHHRFNLSPSKAQVDHLREEVADLRPSAAQQYPSSSLGHWDTGPPGGPWMTSKAKLCSSGRPSWPRCSPQNETSMLHWLLHWFLFSLKPHGFV